MITTLLICDTLAFKVVLISNFDFAASGLIFPISFLLASIATEVYGFQLAGRIIWIQLICQAIFILTVNLFIFLPSPGKNNTAFVYFELYHSFWRVIVSSSIAIPIAYFINDIIMSLMKVYLFGKHAILRFLLSNIIGKLILVSISYPINFYGQYTWPHIIKIGLDTWIYKIVIALILLPVALITSQYIKKIEKLDTFDYGTSYNPLNVFKAELSGINKYATPD